MKRIFWLPPKFEVLCRVLKVFKMYLSCYSLCLRNKYTVEITYIYTSNLCGDIINLQMDAMDITWNLMAPTSKWGYENICHRQSIGTYFLILAHMEVFSELSAGCSTWNNSPFRRKDTAYIFQPDTYKILCFLSWKKNLFFTGMRRRTQQVFCLFCMYFC